MITSWLTKQLRECPRWCKFKIQLHRQPSRSRICRLPMRSNSWPHKKTRLPHIIQQRIDATLSPPQLTEERVISSRLQLATWMASSVETLQYINPPSLSLRLLSLITLGTILGRIWAIRISLHTDRAIHRSLLNTLMMRWRSDGVLRAPISGVLW